MQGHYIMSEHNFLYQVHKSAQDETRKKQKKPQTNKNMLVTLETSHDQHILFTQSRMAVLHK